MIKLSAAVAGLLVFLALTPDLIRSEYTTRVREPPSNKSHDWPCPEANDIKPCTCLADEYYNLRLFCTGVKSNQQLADIFQAPFPFTDFTELRIDSSNDLTEIFPVTFGTVTFERFAITDTKLNIFHEDALTLSHNTLKLLDLHGNALEEFPFGAISSFTVLESFKIDDNYFTRLPLIVSNSLKTISVSGNKGLSFDQNVFKDLPSLESVYMANIDLQVLTPDLFDYQSYLKVINLEGNKIGDLDEAAFFPHNASITNLILSQNNIGFIRHDAIHGLDSNAIVSLVGNQLQELPQETWEDIFLQILPHGIVDLTNNPLNCNCDMKWIFLEPDNKYLPLITEGTTCYDGTQLTTLDANWFTIHCP